MAQNIAVIILSTPDGPDFSLTKSVGGAPDDIAKNLMQGFAGYRRQARRSPGQLLFLLGCSEGFSHAHRFRAYHGSAATDEKHDWRYEIFLQPRVEILIHVTFVTPRKIETWFDGSMELFITRALRNKIKKPKGRTPRGYDSRAEYEMDLAARKAFREEKRSPLPHPWQESVRAEQRASNAGIDPSQIPNLRVHTKEESLRRLKKSRRK